MPLHSLVINNTYQYSIVYIIIVRILWSTVNSYILSCTLLRVYLFISIGYFDTHYPTMIPPGYGAGDIIAVSQLVAKVYAAFKDAPKDYRDICGEVKSLKIRITKAIQHIQSTTLSDDDRQEGQEVLKGCQSVLEDLNSLIEKYNSLASANRSQVLKKVQFGTEDIATLRIKLISNISLLNGFIQRFDIPTIYYYLLSIPC